MFDKILLLICLLVGAVYLFIKKRYTHWSSNGIPYSEPEFPYGYLKDVGTKCHMSIKLKNIYDEFKYKKPFIGVYSFISPVVLVADLELLKSICVTDFNHFMNRNTYYNKKGDPLSVHLLTLESQEWKDLRAKLTPTFTSGKMKVMFPTMLTIAEQLKNCLNKEIEKNQDFEMKDILARFTTDIIGTVAFGIDCDSLNNPDTEFRVVSKFAFQSQRYHPLIVFLILSFKDIARFLNVKIIKERTSKFFLNIVRQTIDYRMKNKIERNDFMNMLMKLYKEDNEKNDKYGLTFHEIAAQTMVFFFAGFETSSTAMSYALHELSYRPDLQERARNEIKNVLEKHGGELSYEAISNMKYIDQIINESLRKYPPAPHLGRVCSMDYRVPGTEYTIKKGDNISIPVYAIHHDPDYYHNPEEFDPERFTEEEISKRHPFSFIPFGEGPRHCIGIRFAMMQTRIGLITILANYKLSPGSKSKKDLTFKPSGVILTANEGLWVKLQKI